MKGAECDFCGLNQSDLMDEFDSYDTEVLFDVSLDGKMMACQGCAIGREGFYQWTPEV